MNTRVIAGLALTGAAVLASCSQDRSPAVSLPTEATFAKGSAPTCSFSTATNDAKAYFSLQKDPVYALLDAMQTAYRIGGPAGATSAGFAVLARYAEATNLGLVKPLATEAGNKGVNDVLLCMGYTQTIDFSKALGPNGLFEVRDGSSNAAVVSHLVVNNYPGYGAEPKEGENWPLSTTAIFYGETLGGSSIAGQTAAGLLFDLRTLPTGPFTAGAQFLVGVCDVSSLSARTLPGFCDPVSSSSGFLGGAKSLFASVFSVAPLYAMPLGGGGAGLVSGLSEIGPVRPGDVHRLAGLPGTAERVERRRARLHLWRRPRHDDLAVHAGSDRPGGVEGGQEPTGRGEHHSQRHREQRKLQPDGPHGGDRQPGLRPFPELLAQQGGWLYDHGHLGVRTGERGHLEPVQCDGELARASRAVRRLLVCS
jgi:hypothetical protein